MSYLETEAQEWIEAVSGEGFTGASFADSLKDGVILCKLINRIKPGSVARVNEPATMPFKKMENIANYLKAARALGMKEFEMFGTPDLFEEKNVQGVVKSIHALGRLLQTIMPDSPFPKLGVKVAAKNERTFTEDQMRQARSAVSVLNLGSSDMGKKATASLLEGRDAQAGFLGKAGAKPKPPPAAAKPNIVAPHLMNRDPVMQVKSAGIVPPRVGGAASLTVVPATVAAPARAAAPAVVVAAAPAAAAGLPAGWEEVTSAEGETYYYNEGTGETAWDKPVAAVAAAAAPAPVPEPAPVASSSALLAGWEEVKTPEGEVYFFNEGTGETAWDPPLAAGAAPAAVETAPESAAAAGLPAGWEEVTSAEGEVYYAHADGRTSWDRPSE